MDTKTTLQESAEDRIRLMISQSSKRGEYISLFWSIKEKINILVGILPSTRLLISLLCTLIMAFSFVLRTNLSISESCMLTDWSKAKFGNLQASFFYGYIMTQLLGGILAYRLGPRTVICFSLAGASSVTMLMPTLADIGYSFAVLQQVLIGVFLGMISTSVYQVVSAWIPAHESGKLIGLIGTGPPIGIILAHPICIEICMLNSAKVWKWSFYIPVPLYGCLSDLIVERRYLSLSVVRKLNVCIGCIIPAVTTLVLGLLGSGKQHWTTKTVLLLIAHFAIAANSGAGIYLSPNDMAPSYAGAVWGVGNTLATIVRIACVRIITVVQEKDFNVAWMLAMYGSSLTNILAPIVFCLLANTTDQFARPNEIELEDMA
ncbi:hypothetical protein ACOME3_006140 [Neoechinorhynchus agilis]